MKHRGVYTDLAEGLSDMQDTLNTHIFESRKNRKYILEKNEKGQTVVYYFPITIDEQLDRFIDRCCNYYKLGE